MVQPIERKPRGTPEYEEKLARLDEAVRRRVELVEESILADLTRTHSRRKLPDGTTFDLTAYDETGILESFRDLGGGLVKFIDFAIYDPQP